MIIVSQDKSKIINFSRIEVIGQDEDNKKRIGCAFDEGSMHLGKYDTEERAKEVLQEIIKAYLNCNEQNVLAEFAYVKNVVFEMPKE